LLLMQQNMQKNGNVKIQINQIALVNTLRIITLSE